MFNYERERNLLQNDAKTMIKMVERIGTLVSSTGVFRVGEVIEGDSWTCLVMLKALKDAGLITLVDAHGMTQEHIYTSHALKGADPCKE